MWHEVHSWSAGGLEVVNVGAPEVNDHLLVALAAAYFIVSARMV